MIDKPGDVHANPEPYGLVRADGTLRPAFHAYQVVTTYFAGARKASLVRRGEIDQVTIDRGERTTTVLWNRSSVTTTIAVQAISPQAVLVNKEGESRVLTSADGQYVLTLNGALCSDPTGCFIGGSPLILVEEGAASARGSLQPTSTPTATPTSTATTSPTTTPTTTPTNTPSPTPMPTVTPTPPPTPTPTTTLMPSLTATPTATNTPLPTPTLTPSLTPTATSAPAPLLPGSALNIDAIALLGLIPLGGILIWWQRRA